MRQMMIGNITRILEVVGKWPVQVRLNDPGAYRLGYTALRNLFDKLDFEKIDDIRAGGYAVYGWMPRILRRWASDETLLALGQLAIIARTKPRNVVRLALDQQRPTAQSPLLAFNGSAVGTSKFLHFVSPAVFPIWDSVVASNFGIRKQSELSRQSYYVDYFDAVHTCIEDNAQTRALLQPLLLPGVTQVRSLEYLLFRYGQKRIAVRRRKAAKAPK